ncbi:MAG TPA: hypothetical protein VIW24_31550 [Aldersonia sp.]
MGTDTEVLDRFGFEPAELAAALNVDLADVRGWLAGTVPPPSRQRQQLDALLAAGDTLAVHVAVDGRGRPWRAPALRWQPILTPQGRFRLPLVLEWSGGEGGRWRDARRRDDVLDAYSIVLAEGSVADMIAWVDPALAAKHLDRMVAVRFRPAWARYFTGIGISADAA